MTNKGPIITLLPFWLYVLFFKFGAGLHYTLLPTLGERILPIWVVGMVIGGASLLQLIFDVPAGFALDRFGYVRILRISSFVFLLGALVFLFGLSVQTFIISIFLGFIGWLFYGPGIDAYTLASAKADSGGKFMGLQHTFGSLGIVLSTMLLPFVIGRGAPAIGLVIASILFFALIMIIRVKKEAASVHDIPHQRKAYYIRRHFLHKVLAAVKRLNPASTMLALQNLSSSIFYGVIWFTVPLIIVHQSNSTMLGLGLGIFDLAVVVLGAFLGRLADRHHKKTLVFLGLLIFSVAGILLGFHFGLLFLLLGFLATVGDEMSNASLWSWLERLDKKHSEDGLVTGAMTLFEDIGWTVGPVIAGFLFGAVGPTLTIAIGALPILATWLFALVFLGPKRSPELLSEPSYPHKPIRHRHKK